MSSRQGKERIAFIKTESLIQIKNRFFREMWPKDFSDKLKNKASKITVDLTQLCNRSLKLNIFYLKTNPASYF